MAGRELTATHSFNLHRYDALYLQVKSVVHLLLSSLDTPSQQVSSWGGGCGLWSHDVSCDPSPQVQEAIANCLPPLASVIKSDTENIINKLLDKVLHSSSSSTSFLPLLLLYLLLPSLLLPLTLPPSLLHSYSTLPVTASAGGQPTAWLVL